MLLLTLAVSILTFGSGRTNVLQGAVHLILFIAYVLLIFQGDGHCGRGRRRGMRLGWQNGKP